MSRCSSPYQPVMPSYKGQLTDEQINSLVAFIHPRAAHGVLIELVQYAGDGR